jgi:membrane associated rhomboid family serine protease
VGVFVLQYFAALLGISGGVLSGLGLWPRAVLTFPAFWQLFTYLFLHGGFMHILVNMFMLWMFGSDLERDWGTRRFLQYYFLCGAGAGVCVVLASLIFGGMDIPTIGASGAIFCLLLAFVFLYPDRIILFMLIFPIKAKYFVMIMAAIEFMYSLSGSMSGVSHIAHLGGAVVGFLYLKRRLLRVDVTGKLARQYHSWKLQRAKRKFEVYMRKRHSDHDRWVN